MSADQHDVIATATLTIEDRIEIEGVLYQYLEGLDRYDVAQFLAVFTDDAEITIQVGSNRQSFAGIDRIREFLEIRQGNAFHITTDSTLVADGDHAIRHARFLAFPSTPSPDGTPIVKWIGRSRDTLVRVGGRWLIQLRELHVLQGASPHPQ